LDLVIDGSRGLPRLLRSIAQLAFFGAASEGASQIGVQHVNNALASRGTYDPREAVTDGARASGHAVSAPQVRTTERSDPLVPRVGFENHKRDAVGAVQERLASRESETETLSHVSPVPVSLAPVSPVPVSSVPVSSVPVSPVPVSPVPVSPEYVAIVSGSGAVPSPTGDDRAQAISSSAAIEIRPITPLASPLPNQPLKLLVGGRTQESRPVQGRWLSRSVGITGALVVSFAIAGVISSNLTSKSPNNATRIPAFPVVSKPVDVSKAVVQPPAPVVVQPPAPVKATTNSAALGQAPDRAPAAADPTDANKDVSIQRPKLGATVRAQITTPSRTGAVTGTANPPTRANRAAEEAAARKLAEDKSRAEREAGDHIKSAVDQKPVVEPVQQAPAEQAAVKAAEDRASAERAAADRQAIAEEKAAADKAAADRAKAAEVAALQAQQAAKLAQEQEGARQAKAAKDLADKALKDAADREKAEKEADEQYKAERREANRVFAHTLFGFSR
jgi:hypothetical protein